MKLTPELLEKFAKVLEKNDLSEFSYEEEDCSLHLIRKHPGGAPIVHAQPIPQTSLPQPQTSTTIAPPAQETKEEDGPNIETVKSPIVGTAYLSPEPGAPTFVKVGDTVQKGQVLMIIEAMKVMNQLKAPISGTIKSVLVSDAKPVEYEEHLIKIEKA